jgi:quercetin dioxygenase-like cupin family protein
LGLARRQPAERSHFPAVSPAIIGQATHPSYSYSRERLKATIRAPGAKLPKSGDILDLSPIGAIFRVTKTAEETQGASFEMEWELLPQTGGTPVHIHPTATESYEVLSGELDLYVDGVWRRLSAGELASVGPGVPHTFRNGSDTPARVYNRHAPAMNFGEYFEGLHRVVRSGAVSSSGMTLKAILYLALHMTQHEEEIRSVRPPHLVMRLMALVARLIGYTIPPASPGKAATGPAG